MITRLFAVLMVLCCISPAVAADDVIYRAVKPKTRKNPIRISGVKPSHQTVVPRHFVGQNERAAVKVVPTVPAQILPSQSLQRTQVVRKSAGYNPDFQYRCPWAWSELRREISSSAEYDRRRSRKQNQLPLHGGALISESAE
ncbi:hypothetical protein [Gimesia sp.]|uniref:hypothetical protein n=1 Tax=Gimesia sp. TaxID=2024833 RepID=UPI0025BEE7E0|nr:hypothetical protein [Gimesia sp.]